jgi:hypothetical protein
MTYTFKEAGGECKLYSGIVPDKYSTVAEVTIGVDEKLYVAYFNQ